MRKIRREIIVPLDRTVRYPICDPQSPICEISRGTQISRRIFSLGALVGLSSGLSACAGESDIPGAPHMHVPPRSILRVIAYASMKRLLDSLISHFITEYSEGNNKPIGFTTSYGPSADQSRKIVRGVPADIAVLSMAPDFFRLVNAGVLSKDWESRFPHRSVPFGSVVAFVVRKGNPWKIHHWDDLLQSELQVLTPDPRSSGSAKWNVLAPYMIYSQGGKFPQKAHKYLYTLIHDHTRLLPSSARIATTMFAVGEGDVLISYENEATLLARMHPGKYEVLVPPETMRIDNPVAVLDNSDRRVAAEKFVDYVYSLRAVSLITQAGFRVIGGDVVSHPGLWTMPELGGWKLWDDRLFGAQGEITQIFHEAINL